MINQPLTNIHKELLQLRKQLFQILVNKKSGVNLSHMKKRESIYNYLNTSPKPTIRDKATINHKIRQNISYFIQQYVGPHVKKIIEINDSYKFVQTMSQVWGNFQRFVFAHDFIVDKLKQFFQSVWKMSNAKDFSDSGKSQVVPIPIIAVNELKAHYQKKSSVLQAFPKIFSNFIAKQRQGTLIPRQMLKDTVAAIESSLFDFEAIVTLDSNRKPTIIKNLKQCDNAARKSKDAQYFQKNIMGTIISDCQSYYRNLVRQRTPKLIPTDQIDLMGKIISEQQSRSAFYIHTAQNQRKYIDTVDKTLIGLDLQSRIRKQDGLIKYLRQFQADKQQYMAQLAKFWKIYNRISKQSLNQIVSIYSQYLDEQAIVAQQKIQKAMQFIPEMIRINTKNIKIVQIFGQNFDLENKRNEKIRGMLSNQIIKASKLKGKHTLGATNLALYVNTKFKQMYGKNDQTVNQMVQNLVNLFKILQQKVHYTKQHQKFISNRLLEDIDFSKDIEYATIIQLQKKFVEEMQKQMGVSQVKQLLQNIRDIQKSVDHTKRLKQKVSNKIHILNQIIIKNNTFWPEKNTFEITPPNVLLKISTQVQNYFNKTSNIQFQFYNGVSLFRGQFKSKVPKQNFNLKNIYLIILLLLDQSQNKKMLFGDLKMKIKSFGSKKDKGNLELAKNVIELLHIGLILSSSRVLSKDDPKCVTLSESDAFELNPQFDYEQQLKKNKVPPKMIKKLPVIKTSNIQMTPDWLKKMFVQQSNKLADDQVNIEKQRKFRVKQIAVKCLKHAARHSNINCSFQQLFNQYSSPKNKQYRVTQKYLKEILQELINDEYCQRVEGQRNVFKYKA